LIQGKQKIFVISASGKIIPFFPKTPKIFDAPKKNSPAATFLLRSH